MSYFIFNGVDSRNFGIVTKSGFSPIAERTLKTVTIPGRAEPLNRLEIMRKNTKISLTVTITDISRMAEINAWLQGKGELIFSTDMTRKYHAYVNQSITPTRVHKLCGSVPIVFTTEPFAYSVTNPFVSTPMGMNDDSRTGSMTIISNGTAESEPLWYFSFAGKLRVTVNDEEPLILTSPGTYTNEYEASASGEYASKYYYDYTQQNIYIDTSLRLAYIKSNDKNVIVVNQTSGRFPTLKNGENTILLELVKEEWEYNNKLYVSHNQKLLYFGYRKNERWY